MNYTDLGILPTTNNLFRTRTTTNKDVFCILSSLPPLKLRINSHIQQNNLSAA